ncbi:fad fmn-binding family protein [Stylonychia lemnae]|uniref:Fad fmn-binding family protein n=1 Tax=Stylonychia lemnae TaxID=5949 RepID=A0A078B122_STYLE|nr:fad fmn-binding family protein [Stylonychia lemnae]|eukprot:CDW88259.1 fad fmn-binding family protein [Stylonychia lemnae]
MGDLELPNRIVMAALTRCRCDPSNGVPTDLHKEYYSARAESAFMLSECSSIRPDGNCFPGSTGIYSDEQVEGWKKVIDEVHAKGGRIYLQIWHSGRAAHSDHLGGQTPISSSAIAIADTVHTQNGRVAHVTPRAVTVEEIKQLIKDFRQGAENAKRAGFDGVQLHGAHGYLVDQFLRNGCNQRDDEYGGSIENRARFCLEILDELIEVFGADRVGIKLSPVCDYNGLADSDPFALVEYLFGEFNKKGIAFVEVNEALTFDPATAQEKHDKIWANHEKKTIRENFRHLFKGTFIGNYQLDFEKATNLVENNITDLCSFGISYVCNDNLVERFRTGAPINGLHNVKDFSKLQAVYLYGNTALGYTDLTPYSPDQE